MNLSSKSPLCTYSNLRNLLGPHASKELLVTALSGGSHVNLQWAVNTYYRDIFTKNSKECQDDFSLKPKCTGSPHKENTRAFRQSFKDWPFAVFLFMAAFLDYSDLISLSSTSKQLRVAITEDEFYSELLWGQLLITHQYKATYADCESSDHIVVRAGEIVPARTETPMCITKEDARGAYAQFRTCHQLELSRDCLSCSGKRCVVPVIYGFPSPALLQHFHKKSLRFGGDNLVEGLACWSCLKCDKSLYAYPYLVGVIKCGSSDQSLGRARYQGARAMPWSFGSIPKNV